MSDLAFENALSGRTSRGRIRAFDAAVLVLLMLAIWQTIGSWTNGVAVSPPLQTLVYLFGLVRTWMFWEHAAATLAAFLLAFVLSALIGLALGLIFGVQRFTGEVAEPILAGFYTIPKVTLYPVVLLIFGLGISGKVVFGAMHGILPVALLTMGAIRAIPQVYLRSARTLHLSPWQTITTVLLPAALPEVFTGLRIGFTVTLLGVLLGEMFASKLGLGSMIMSDMSLAQSEDMVTVAIILFVCVYTFAHFGFKIDARQTHFEGIDFKSAAQAVVFAIFSYVGFESAATLGRETRNPTVNIPRAIVATAISAGVFFVLTTYLIVQGFEDDATKLGASGAPLADITSSISVGLTALVYFGAAISGFACALASLNAYGRMLFSLGRYQFVHTSMGLVHQNFKTPYVALTSGALINFIVCAAFVGQAETDTFGWYGTLASYGFIIVYFLCSVSAPVFLAKNGGATAGDKFVGGLGAVLMVLSLVGSLYPVPASPYNLFPYFFLVYILLGVSWFFILKARVPQAILGIEHDLEIAAATPAE